MIKCSECGYENIDGLDYCDGCGAKLDAAAASAQVHAEGATAGTAPTHTESATAPAAEHPSAESATQEPAHEPVAESAAEPAAASAETAAAATPESRAATGEISAPAAPAPSAAPVAPGAPFKAKLSIIRGSIPERRGHEFELETGNNLLGRWDPETGAFPEVDLDRDDPEAKISRKHALIRIEGDKITIEDIGSLNGTFVNRQPRLAPGTPVELKAGDEIIIGKTFLKLHVDTIS